MKASIPSAMATPALKIREMPQDERPREKLLSRGAAALSDPELIALLLRTGLPGANAVEVARRLLDRYGSLSGLSRCSVTEIASIPGIGPAKAIQLVAAFGLGQRLANERLSRQKLDSPELVHDLVAAEMRTLHRNHCASSFSIPVTICCEWKRFRSAA